MPVRPRLPVIPYRQNLLMLLALAALLSGCRNDRNLSKESVIAHLPTKPTTLHPTNGNGAYRELIFQYTQMRLQRTDLRNGELLHPLLTKPPEPGPDSLRYTYQLKKGITWDDSTPLTVKDVLFTLKMNVCPLTDNPSRQSSYDPINRVEIRPEADRTFTLVFDRQHFANSRIFENGLYLMQRSKEDRKGVMTQFSVEKLQDPDFEPDDHPRLQAFMKRFNAGSRGNDPGRFNGLGPYKVTEWQNTNIITLERKPDWWGQDSDLVYHQQAPDKIVFKVIRDNFAAGLALRNSSLDVSAHISLNELSKSRHRAYFRKQYRSGFVKRYGYTYIGLNMRPGLKRDPYFAQQKVRKAIAHLVPVQELIKVIANGRAQRLASFVSPLKPSYNDQLPLIRENIPKARQLLKEAGWQDDDGDGIRDTVINKERIPFRFEFNYIKDPNHRQVAVLIQQVMEEAGISLQPRALEFSTFYKQARNHNFDAMLGKWGGYSGPENPRQLWHTENWINNGSNFTGFGSAETDSLIEAANRTLDTAERHPILKNLQARVHEQQPYVFLYSKKRGIAIHRRFDTPGMYRERPGVILNNFHLKNSPGQAALP